MTDAEIQGHEKRLLMTEDQIIMKKKRFVKPSGCHLGVFFRDIRSKLTLKMQKRQVAKLTSAKLKKKGFAFNSYVILKIQRLDQCRSR